MSKPSGAGSSLERPGPGQRRPMGILATLITNSMKKVSEHDESDPILSSKQLGSYNPKQTLQCPVNSVYWCNPLKGCRHFAWRRKLQVVGTMFGYCFNPFHSKYSGRFFPECCSNSPRDFHDSHHVPLISCCIVPIISNTH